MKKLLVILLLTVYGFTATGMTLHFHFCCGKLDDVSLSPSAKKCGNMTHSDGKKCCDEQQVSLKVKDAQHLSDAVKLCLAPYTLPANNSLAPLQDQQGVQPIKPALLSPPPLCQPLNILYCVYRI